MIESEIQGVEYFNQRSISGARSGWGSVGHWAALKKKILKEVWPFDSMLDIGCGDMVYLSTFKPFVSNKFRYLGVDGSADVIRKARKKCPGRDFRRLMVSELVKTTLNREYSVVTCYDVLFHIVEDSLCNDLLLWLFDSSAKALALTFLRVNKEGPRKGHFIIRDFSKVSIPSCWRLEIEEKNNRRKRQRVALFIRTMDKN